MIKTEEEISKIREAGYINHLTHQYLQELIKPDVTTEFLNNEADRFIRSKGGQPGFLGFNGFPKSICISINEEVVHGLPSQRSLKEGDLVKIDIGVVKEGYHSDAARTYPVGKVNKEKMHLMHHTEKALYIGLKEVKAGAYLHNIGARISGYAKKQGLGVVRDLMGHGVGKELHEEPDVPNFGKWGTGIKLMSGMVLAIEPMLNAGKGNVEILNDNWTIVTKDGKPSAHFEHTVLVTKDGYEILTGE
jgi:methionyl aminopeptidase